MKEFKSHGSKFPLFQDSFRNARARGDNQASVKTTW